MEFIKLVDCAEVGDHFAWDGFFSVFGVPCVLFVEVEQFLYFLSTLIGYAVFCDDALDGKFQRVGFCGGAKFCPVGCSVFVHSPQLEGVGSFRRQVFEEQRGVFDGGVEHAVEADFIEVGVVHFFPGGCQFVGFGVGVRDLGVCRS